MKVTLTLFLFLLASKLFCQSDLGFLQVTYKADGYSIEKVFSDLEKDYGIRFSYATSSIEDKKIRANFEDDSIEDVIDYLLSDLKMEYKIISNNILLRKSEAFNEKEDDSYQESIHLKGRVVQMDKVENSLDLATIAVRNTSIGTYTDETGRFDLEVPSKYLNEQIIIHSLGYKDVSYTIKELQDAFVMISLETGGFSIAEVTIVNRKKPIRISSNVNALGIDPTGIASGMLGSDFSRQLQMLPGVSASNDASSEIRIRGSNHDETMVILDGLPLYHTSHYFGIFSSINTAFVDSINLFKNNYPLQYDGKTGGVVELFSRNRQVEEAQFFVEANLLTGSTAATLPLSKTTQLTFAARTSMGNVSNSQFNTFAPSFQELSQVNSFMDPMENRATDPQFSFYDINAKLQTRLRGSDLISIQFYNSTDNLSNTYQRSIEDNRKDRLDLEAQETANWMNSAMGLNYSTRLSRSLTWESRLYYSSFNSDIVNDYQIEEKPKGGMQGSNPKVSNLRSSQSNSLSDFGIDSHLSLQKGKNQFQIGLCATQHQLLYKVKENRRDKLDGGKDFYELGVYGEYTQYLGDRLSVQTGLRASTFTLNRGSYLSPRSLFTFAWSDEIGFKASYGYYQQVIRQFQYEYRGEPMDLWVSAGQNNIPVLKSHNSMIGATAKFARITFDIEVYQKNMDGMLEYAVLNPGNGSANPAESRDYKLFKGNGIGRGIDILLGSSYKMYESTLSYSLSKTEQRFKNIVKNAYFPTEDDRRHQLKWVNSLKKGNIIWGANAVFISGRVYTDLQNLGAQGDILETRPEERFTRLPAYKRMDLSASYNFNLSKMKSTFSIELYNVLNAQNVKYIQSVSTKIDQNDKAINTVIGSESNLLGRTINLSLKIGI